MKYFTSNLSSPLFFFLVIILSFGLTACEVELGSSYDLEVADDEAGDEVERGAGDEVERGAGDEAGDEVEREAGDEVRDQGTGPSMTQDLNISPSSDQDPPIKNEGPCGSNIGSGVHQLNPNEQVLADLLNAYRMENNLPALPVSAELSYVALRHSEDQTLSYPFNNPSCNLHSWGDSADEWTACCYTGDHANPNCMWDKPQEMTSLQSRGFEISSSGYPNAAAALEGWKSSDGHNSVILNLGVWKDLPFEQIGVGICGTYYNVWFTR